MIKHGRIQFHIISIALYEHVTFINMKMEIFGAPDSLKYKILSRTFRGVTLWWYMGQPRIFITSYQDLVKKLVHQFITSRHIKIISIDLFNIRQGPYYSIRKYFIHFNEVKIKVLHSKIFIRAFQYGLRTRHFNEVLAHRPTTSLGKVVTHVKCCLNGKESNTENKARYAKKMYL